MPPALMYPQFGPVVRAVEIPHSRPSPGDLHRVAKARMSNNGMVCPTKFASFEELSVEDKGNSQSNSPMSSFHQVSHIHPFASQIHYYELHDPIKSILSPPMPVFWSAESPFGFSYKSHISPSLCSSGLASPMNVGVSLAFSSVDPNILQDAPKFSLPFPAPKICTSCPTFVPRLHSLSFNSNELRSQNILVHLSSIDFVHFLLKFVNLEFADVFPIIFTALVYFEISIRKKSLRKGITVRYLTLRLMACLILSSKWHDDNHAENSIWSEKFRVSLKSLNRHERSVASLLDYNLFVHENDLKTMWSCCGSRFGFPELPFDYRFP